MANILVMDTDESSARELTECLSRRLHQVAVRRNATETVAELRAGNIEYELIALNMSRDRSEDWEALEQIQEFVYHSNALPKIVCFSNIQRGP